MDQDNSRTISAAAKSLAILFAVLLGLVIMFLLLFLTLEGTLLNANFVKGVLVDQNVYDQLPQLIAISTKSNTASADQAGDSSNAVSIMTTEQLSQLIGIVLPEGYLQTEVERDLDSVYAFVNLQTTEMHLTINMQPIKDNLSGEAGKQVMLSYIDSLPVCTEEQAQALLQWQANPEAVQGAALCKPPESVMAVAIPKIDESLQKFVDSMPAQIDLSPQGQANGTDTLVASVPYQIYRVLRFAMNYVPWVAGFLAVLIILLTLRSGKTMFACLGVPALVGGLIGGACSLLSLSTGKTLVASMSSRGNPFDPMISGIIGEVMHSFSMSGLIFCGAAVLIGVVLLLMTLLFRK
jgi:hypothetical protein